MQSLPRPTRVSSISSVQFSTVIQLLIRRGKSRQAELSHDLIGKVATADCNAVARALLRHPRETARLTLIQQ